MNGDAAQLAVDLLALTEMDTRAHVEPKLLHGRHDRGRTLQGGCGRGEGREEPVAGGVLLAAGVLLQFAPDDLAEMAEHDPPAAVSKLDGELRRADDVEEEHRSEPPARR